MKSAVLSMALALVLTACTAAPPATKMPELTFDQVAPVTLNVAVIEVVDKYASSGEAPYVEHTFSVPPAAATRRLIDRQLVAGGAENHLRALIEDASVSLQTLPVAKDFAGLFRVDPAERYSARVSVRFELFSPAAPDIILGHASVVSDRTKTLMEDASPADRDRAILNLTEELMKDLSNGFETVVFRTFGRE